MREDFEKIKVQIDIATVARCLLGHPNKGGMFKHPSERTASIKVYPCSQTFRDFGRSVGGDCIELWSHVRGCSRWRALQEIRETFNLPDASACDRPSNLRQRIQEQERIQAAEQEAKRRAKLLQITRIEYLQERLEIVERLIQSDKLPPFCDLRMQLYDYQASLQGRLDELCGVCDSERR